jgi:hypothetical protein
MQSFQHLCSICMSGGGGGVLSCIIEHMSTIHIYTKCTRKMLAAIRRLRHDKEHLDYRAIQHCEI